MTIIELYKELKEKFLDINGVSDLLGETVTVIADKTPEATLMPEGYQLSSVKRGEYRVNAQILGSKGEAYTELASDFSGTLDDALNIPVSDKGISAITISAINAVLAHLGLCQGTFSDESEAHTDYASRLCEYVKENYDGKNIILVGYDGYIVKNFMDEGIDFWTMDKDPDNITQDRFNHVIVNSGKYNRECCFAWGKLFIVTGSTLCNGTITQYLNKGKDILLYGITASGAAALLDLPIFR